MFFLADVDGNIAERRGIADDLAFVHLFAGGDEKDAPFLRVEQTVSNRLARFKSDKASRFTAGEITLIRLIFKEYAAHYAFAAGKRQKFALKAEKSARRNIEFKAHSVTDCLHVYEITATCADRAHDRAVAVAGDVDDKPVDRFKQGVAFLFEKDFGRGYRKLIAFAAHCFDKNGKVHFAASGHFETVGAVGVFDAQGNVFQKFRIKPFSQALAGDEFTFLAGKGTVVYGESHLHGGVGNFDELARFGVFGA